MARRFWPALWAARVTWLALVDLACVGWVVLIVTQADSEDLPALVFLPAIVGQVFAMALLLEATWRVKADDALGEGRGPVHLGSIGPFALTVAALAVDSARETSFLAGSSPKEIENMLLASSVPGVLAFAYAGWLLTRWAGSRRQMRFIVATWAMSLGLSLTFVLFRSEAFQVTPFLPLIVGILATSFLVHRGAMRRKEPDVAPASSAETPTFRRIG